MTAPEEVVADAVEAVVIRPGDTLIVRVSPRTTMDQLHRAKAQLVDLLPTLASVIYVAAEQILVYRPDGGA